MKEYLWSFDDMGTPVENYNVGDIDVPVVKAKKTQGKLKESDIKKDEKVVVSKRKT